jgi:preprotein translocase subunit SecD
MAVYYKFSGLLADMALLLNLFLLLAALAGLQAALTLPGIAGIVLTMGIAVDANVLIFERVREELRNGRPVRGAIETGYARAFTTILDANVTTILTAVVLYLAGTGPIKGFAITLIVGIAISMFTALVVTRFVFDYITLTRKVGELSI